mgnify:FL=1
MRPLIAVATNPFYSSYADIPLQQMEAETMKYFWLPSELTEKICSSIRAAGGLPLLLTAASLDDEIDAAVRGADGFLFAGGEDMAHVYYDLEDRGTISPNPLRDNFETKLFQRAYAENKPILGICRGCQLINVMLGGTLYQNLASVKSEWALHSRSDETKGYVHEAEILMNEYFPLCHERTIKVNSMHHQAIDQVASPLEVTVQTADGLVEGVSMPSDGYLRGVQWHPECLAAADAVNAEIFSSLVRACRRQSV